MKVLISKTCSADGQHLENGQTYEVSDSAAKDLIKFGRATEAVNAPATTPKTTPKKPKVITTKTLNGDSN
tara:strand:- start:27 stop:236 length:210 start_codon:yes stop_codon:yes gene_type:complete